MAWIFVAFLEPIFHAFANVLDSNLTNRFFKNAWLLTVFIALSVVIFLPLVWLVGAPKLIPLSLLPYFLLVAAIELVYGYPYFKALQNDDTSVAISLFSLGQILVPVLAFFWLGEILQPHQYLGFLLIIICSAALTFNPKSKLKLNSSFFYMLLSSSLLAVETVVYKYIFLRVSWATGYAWTSGLSAAIALFSLLPMLPVQSTKSELVALKKHYLVILLVGFVGFLGGVGFSYAVFAVPTTVARSVSSFQPFFVLLYAITFRRFFPLAFKEQVDFGSIVKKVLLFIVTVIGVVLTVK